ncbi:MAG: O-methyltransferase [Limisphaerales bacterium]
MKTTPTLITLLLLVATSAGQGLAQPAGDRPPRPSAASTFTSTPLARDAAEQKILEVLEEMAQSQRRGGMSVPREDGRFLRLLTESLGAEHVVELGTYHGYSGIWLCLALRTTGGKLTTFEIDAQRATTSRENFQRAGVSALVNLVEGDAHQEVTKLTDSIDLIFLDADKEGYVDYLNKLLPRVRPGGLIVAHNIDAAMADPDYLKAITTNPALESLFLNVGGTGLSLTLKKR